MSRSKPKLMKRPPCRVRCNLRSKIAGNLRPAELSGFLGQAVAAQVIGWAIDSVFAQNVVGKVFDFGDNTVSSLPMAALHNHQLGFHGQPPFAPHLVRRQNEEEKFTDGAIFRQIDLPRCELPGCGYCFGIVLSAAGVGLAGVFGSTAVACAELGCGAAEALVAVIALSGLSR